MLKLTILYYCGESCSSNMISESCPKLSRTNRLINPQMSNKGLQKKRSRASIKGRRTLFEGEVLDCENPTSTNLRNDQRFISEEIQSKTTRVYTQSGQYHTMESRVHLTAETETGNWKLY